VTSSRVAPLVFAGCSSAPPVYGSKRRSVLTLGAPSTLKALELAGTFACLLVAAFPFPKEWRSFLAAAIPFSAPITTSAAASICGLR
jgi:hypothetical protein